jgi:hypothetical protein
MFYVLIFAGLAVLLVVAGLMQQARNRKQGRAHSRSTRRRRG